jgi:hypothetical protein
MRTITLITLTLALSCSGKTENAVTSPGEDGAAGEGGEEGAPGEDGAPGVDGEDGLDCWDTNGDGEPNPEEDINGDGVVDVEDCRGEGGAGGGATLWGDITFRTPEMMTEFCEIYSEVKGDVTISSANLEESAEHAITDLTPLACLVSVGGQFRISSSQMPSIRLPNLIHAGRIMVTNNDVTTDITFPVLETVDGDLLIDQTGGIDDWLETVQLDELISVGGMFSFVGSQNSDAPYAPFLVEVGTLKLHGEAVIEFDGFESLTTVNQNMTVSGCYSLASFDGLTDITHVGGDVLIAGNAIATSSVEAFIDGIDHIGGTIEYYGNGPG